MKTRLLSGILLALVPAVCLAQSLTMPNAARLLSDRTSALDSYELPIKPFADGALPVRRFEGRIERKTWRINGTASTTLQLIGPLRDQLRAEGYDLVLDCADRSCGGFDFRFETEVVPAPDMHVDIGNYRFVSAIRGPDEAISILVSRSGTAAYFQIIHATPPHREPSVEVTPSKPVEADPFDLAGRLEARGRVTLTDLDFDTGEGALLPGSHDSLAQLAAYLAAHPDQRIVLVGHTDSTGPLETNIALSKQRAGAVRSRLVDKYDVAPARVDAEGVGYLAPIASNLTVEGREANRRVEAILLPKL